ncbi:MAG: 50S ribosomal protein L40e [Thermoprotei archaeon]
MPITDPIKREIASAHLLKYKICRRCGTRVSANSVRCRKCGSYNLRLKKQELRR